MLLLHTVKNILLLVVCVLLLNNLSAQKKQTAFAFKEFVSTDDVANNKYFFVATSPKKIAAYLHNNQLSVARQLNDTAYIVKLIDISIANQFSLIYPANNNWKLSPLLINQEKTNWPKSLLVTVANANAFYSWALFNKQSILVTSTKNSFIIKIEKQIDFTHLLQQEIVNFISVYNNHPKEELQINNLDVSVNKINVLQSKMPNLDGNGMVLSIKENKPDTTDIDIVGRYTPNALAATQINAHATIMATMAAGAGNSYYLGKGVAWGAAITSSNFNNLLPDGDLNYAQNNITVQNHSYGVGVENFYGADAAAYDASAIANDKLLFVFSAGNSGIATPTTGNYAGIAGVANLTGSFKMAKNIITVGAIDSFNIVAGPSSKGPAYDGRIKPEMVAYGEDGSSGAAALVSGTAIVLQQAYKNNNGGSLPSSALVKAVLLNSCDDVATSGIDFTSGFGSLNAYKAADGMRTQKYFTGTVTNNGSLSFSITIPANLSKAKFTLVWNDAPANANAFKAIKNDLDIQLQSTATSQVWLPWVLNSFANKDSLLLLPVRKRDSLNTVEQISIENPVAGNYNVIVNGFNISSGNQPFAIAYQFDTANVFNWVFPTANDNIFSATANVIRWGATFNTTAATLEFSSNNGLSWQLLSSNINLSNNYFKWTAPDTSAIALLRMTVGAQQFISNPFTISAKPILGIGFNCIDSALLFWNKNKSVSSYQLYGLGNKYLVPLSIITDTQFVFNKMALPYKNFAIAPIINSRIGVKSYTTNYANQGVDCYFKNILADLINNNTTLIKLSIGTTYRVNKIVFEKLVNGNFITLSQTNAINSLDYSATDIKLQKGTNMYRAAIYLQSGQIIYSDAVSVIYFDNTDALIYPNPVLQGSNITTQLKSLQNQILTITDALGRKITEKKITSITYVFPANFSKGLYFFSIKNLENNSTVILKIVIQ